MENAQFPSRSKTLVDVDDSRLLPSLQHTGLSDRGLNGFRRSLDSTLRPVLVRKLDPSRICTALDLAGGTNGHTVTRNSNLTRPTLRNQNPVPETTLTIAPASSIPTVPGAFTELHGSNETPPPNFLESPSTQDALEQIRNLSISPLARFESIKDGLTRPLSSEPEEKVSQPKLVMPTSQVPKADNSPAQRQSAFLKGAQNVRSLAFGHSHHKPDDKRLTDLSDRMFNRLRRSRDWLKLPHLSSDHSQNRLEDQLKEAMMKSKCSHRDFLPQRELEELVTQKSVEAELSRWEYLPRKGPKIWRRPAKIRIEAQTAGRGKTHAPSNSDGALLAWAQLKTYRMIFAILMFIREPSKIWSFVEEGVCDADLPLIKVPRGNGLRRFELRRGTEPRKPLKCFKKWRDMVIAEFEEHQWIVLAPFFKRPNDEPVPHYELLEEQILPFTSWRRVHRHGGFGEVYRAAIHPDHHAVAQDVVAVKKLLTDDEKGFRKESEILKNLSSERHTHPHLITLLATYEQGGDYHLVFPWADADLERYWMEIKPEPLANDPAMAKWLIDQCQGLAEGLSKVHRYETTSDTTMVYWGPYTQKQGIETREIVQPNRADARRIRCLFGRHGDIKPRNILWFPSGRHGILKITDFGIARFTSDNGWSPQDRDLVPNSLTYRSPEWDLKRELSTLCDVWALGCVYLEFVTWFFGGRKYVEQFKSKRSYGSETDAFFTIVHSITSGEVRAHVKHAVVQVIDELRSYPACTELFRDLLDVIQHEMLIVRQNVSERGQIGEAQRQQASGALTVPRQELVRRKSSGNIAQDLGDIQIKCERIPDHVAKVTSLPGR